MRIKHKCDPAHERRKINAALESSTLSAAYHKPIKPDSYAFFTEGARNDCAESRRARLS